MCIMTMGFALDKCDTLLGGGNIRFSPWKAQSMTVVA